VRNGEKDFQPTQHLRTIPAKLRLDEVVPYMSLPSSRDVNVDLWAYKQRKNLVILFHHGFECSPCAEKLEELARAYDQVQELEAEILAVSFDRVDQIREYAKRASIPFPLLCDAKGVATERFTYEDEVRGSPLPSVFITDRWGALRYQKIAREADDLPNVEEALSWLLSIRIECPECSHL